MSPHREAQLGSVIAAGGVVWMVAIASKQLQAAGIVIPAEPIEASAVGVVIWLHAKWRGSVGRA